MNERTIAYFSMEIALQEEIHTYSGGLGVLAGDTLRAAADLRLPVVAVTLLHREGYLKQHLKNGLQREESAHWDIEKYVKELPGRVSVSIEGRLVTLRAWLSEVVGSRGYSIPVYFLDADLPENDERDRTLTHWLYGGDASYRFCQEVILGIGGVRMLRTMGLRGLRCFHMNEGHSSLLTLELLDESAKAYGRQRFDHQDVEAVRKMCVFTTHTPVPAGHDQFPLGLVKQLLGRSEIFEMHEVFCCDGVLNMTYLALNLSHYINGVAKRHGEVTRLMFARYPIDSITNGVHAATWATPPIQRLFDHYISGWREDNLSLRVALKIPMREILAAHSEAKKTLLDHVNNTTNATMQEGVFTLGFGRRATPYKRPELLFRDIERLRLISKERGPLQILYSGKAHPHDGGGKELIRIVIEAMQGLGASIKAVYLEDYDLELAKKMVAGVDLWLNTPQPPLEASGTSGMKAAINGVPGLSTLDGWWLEGHIEGVTGWSIGERIDNGDLEADDARDAASLYDKLERCITMFYQEPAQYAEVMRHSIALTGSFFNTHRMLQQYALKAYLPTTLAVSTLETAKEVT